MVGSPVTGGLEVAAHYLGQVDEQGSHAEECEEEDVAICVREGSRDQLEEPILEAPVSSRPERMVWETRMHPRGHT